MAKINPIYRKMIEQIGIDNEEYEEEMKPIYKLQKQALESLNAALGALFIGNGINGLLQLSTFKMAKIRAELQEKLKVIGKNLGQAEVNKVTDILTNVFKDTYYKNAFVMDSGFKIDLKFNLLKKEFIEAAVNQKFKGELFSERIWNNKSFMIDKLQASLIDAMNGKTTIDKIGRDIRDTFNVQAFQSQRLVRTEITRVQSQAIDDIASNTGVSKQLYSATLDLRTNPIDASFDGKVYDLNDRSKPEIPQHPNCRCVYINIPFADWKPTKRKDNETKEIIDYKNYEQWLKDKNLSEG